MSWSFEGREFDVGNKKPDEILSEFERSQARQRRDAEALRRTSGFAVDMSFIDEFRLLDAVGVAINPWPGSYTA